MAAINNAGTPRTDKHLAQMEAVRSGYVEAWFARILERELARANAAVTVALERALNDDATIAGLVAALVDFANWRRPSKRDWDNGAVQDEFDSMQKQARLALVMNYGQPSSGGSGSQTGRPEQSESGAP